MDASLVDGIESALEHTGSKSLESMVSDRLERSRVEPVMRFVLHDASRHTFSVERMTYRGRCDWWPVSGPMSLEFAARKFLKHLGKDSFFELM